MSSVQTVLTFIETGIEAALPTIKKSKNYYNIGDDDSYNINHSYSIRPGDASPVDGVLGKATYDQQFEVELTRSYADKRESDLMLRSAIELIYIDHQEITKELSYRRAPTILLINVPSKGAPVVDDKNKFVSITYQYQIKYRELI